MNFICTEVVQKIYYTDSFIAIQYSENVVFEIDCTTVSGNTVIDNGWHQYWVGATILSQSTKYTQCFWQEFPFGISLFCCCCWCCSWLVPCFQSFSFRWWNGGCSMFDTWTLNNIDSLSLTLSLPLFPLNLSFVFTNGRHCNSISIYLLCFFVYHASECSASMTC